MEFDMTTPGELVKIPRTFARAWTYQTSRIFGTNHTTYIHITAII